MTEPCQDYTPQRDSRLFNTFLMAFVVVIVLITGISTITLFMIQQGNNDQELNKQAIASIKQDLVELKAEASKISDLIVSNQTANVEKLNTLHSDINGLKLDIVAEFSEEAQLDEIRKSEVLEALKYVK